MFLCRGCWKNALRWCRWDNFSQARMVKSADTADLKSADLNRSWGFKSPSGHHRINSLRSRSYQAGRLFFFGTKGDLRAQSVLLNFVQQGAVTNIQIHCSFSPIPS